MFRPSFSLYTHYSYHKESSVVYESPFQQDYITPHIDLQKMIFGFHSNNWLETTISLAIKWNVEFFSKSSHTGVHHVPVHVDSSEEATSLPSYCKR